MWPILNKNVFLISYLVNVLHHLVVKKNGITQKCSSSLIYLHLLSCQHDT